MSIWLQVYMLGTMLIWGVILGIIFDIYRFLLPTTKIKGVTQYVFDTLFWLVITIATFMIMVFANFGEVRVYLIIGMSIGFILYSLTLSKLTMRFLYFLQKLFVKVYKIFKHIILGIYNLIKNIVKIILKLLYIVFYPLIWVINKLFRPIIKGLRVFPKKIINKIKRK